MFGPLFYTTLVVAVPLGIFAAFTQLEPLISEWREVSSLAEQLRSTDPRLRERAAQLLRSRGSMIALPLFLDAARAPQGDVRAALADHWSRRGRTLKS